MKQTHVLIDKSPEIIGPDHIQLKAHLGTQFVLHCKANPNCDNDLTLIYWLVNGSFPEALTTSRISEMEESMSSDGTVQRNLMLRNVTTEDLRSTFVCVVMNPEGVARKHVTLRTLNNMTTVK